MRIATNFCRDQCSHFNISGAKNKVNKGIVPIMIAANAAGVVFCPQETSNKGNVTSNKAISVMSFHAPGARLSPFMWQIKNNSAAPIPARKRAIHSGSKCFSANTFTTY